MIEDKLKDIAYKISCLELLIKVANNIPSYGNYNIIRLKDRNSIYYNKCNVQNMESSTIRTTTFSFDNSPTISIMINNIMINKNSNINLDSIELTNEWYENSDKFFRDYLLLFKYLNVNTNFSFLSMTYNLFNILPEILRENIKC